MTLKNLARPDLLSGMEYSVARASTPASLLLHRNENPWAPENADDPLINRYPEKQPAALLQRLSEMYDVDSAQLLITRGADDGIDALIRSFCEPGQAAIAQCSPTFSMYRFFARLHGIEVIDFPADVASEFAIDLQQLKASPVPKIYFLCNPNNPTGSAMDPGSLKDFAKCVEDRALVVVDEAYIEFAEVESLIRCVSEAANLVVLRTLSKAWSLAGARLGVVISNPDLIRYLLTTTSPYPLARSSVQAALQATTPERRKQAANRIESIIQQRQRMLQELPGFSFVQRVYPGQGNFLLMQVEDGPGLLQRLAERGILLRDQSSQPGLANHVRVSMGSETEMDSLLTVMKEIQEPVL